MIRNSISCSSVIFWCLCVLFQLVLAMPGILLRIGNGGYLLLDWILYIFCGCILWQIPIIDLCVVRGH